MRRGEGRKSRGLTGLFGPLAAIAGGLGAGLAHPPFGFLPGLAGFALLLAALDAASPARPLRSAFLRGWLAGFAYFFVSTWWVGEAFLVDIEAHGWQAPFAVTLLPAGLALFWGAAGLAYRLLAPPGVRRGLVFAALWSVAEWLRGHLLTGFPWNLPGEAWRAGSAPSQAAALVGAYGLTFLTLALAAAPATLARDEDRRGRIFALGAAGLVLAALWGGGAWRLSRAEVELTALTVRVIQPNLSQEAKWSPEHFRAVVDNYVELTARPAARRPDVIVWPESAIPAAADEVFAPGIWTERAFAGATSPGQTLLAGAFRADGERYFNSLYALRRTGAGFDKLAVYDKHRLVPFGEYLPLEPLMERLGLKQLAAVGEGFTAGPEPEPISPAGLPPLQPLICYESLFPGFVAAEGARPSWIVNVSNDAWFGQTSGPWQHLNLASYRAIEEGLPMVRATPTGVSAVIDPYGRTLSRLGLGERGVIDAQLPAPAPATPYSRWRDAAFWIFCALGVACMWRARPRRPGLRPRRSLG